MSQTASGGEVVNSDLWIVLLIITERYKYNCISFKRRENIIFAGYIGEDFLEDVAFEIGLKEISHLSNWVCARVRIREY